MSRYLQDEKWNLLAFELNHLIQTDCAGVSLEFNRVKLPTKSVACLLRDGYIIKATKLCFNALQL